MSIDNKMRETPILARAVRTLRKDLGWTQARLASELGTHVTTVVRYETTRPPRGSILLVFARIADEASMHSLAACFRGAFKLVKVRGHTDFDEVLRRAVIRVGTLPDGGDDLVSLYDKVDDLLSQPRDFRVFKCEKDEEWHPKTFGMKPGANQFECETDEEWQLLTGLLRLLRSEESELRSTLVGTITTALRRFMPIEPRPEAGSDAETTTSEDRRE